jgi:dihydropteroate synthase
VIRGQLGGLPIGDGLPVRIMGVLNASPESFYRGSVATEASELARRAEAMAHAGADLLDVGAMSTAPYLETAISADVEAGRLAGAVASVREAVDLPISADTQRALPARAAVDAGATIVNDVSGLADDPALGALVAAAGVDLILMARDTPPSRLTPIGGAAARLRQALARARAAGLVEARLTVDPGIGFTRQPGADAQATWNLAVLRDLARLRTLGRPILIGVSRKRFIGTILGRDDPGERLNGSLAATAVAVVNGAHVVRTHDVAATREVALVAAAIRDARAR